MKLISATTRRIKPKSYDKNSLCAGSMTVRGFDYWSDTVA